MNRLLLSAAILFCASAAHAGNFAFYGPGGNAITGYTNGNSAYGYDTRGNSYRWTYTPSYPTYSYPVFQQPTYFYQYQYQYGYQYRW